MCLILFLAQCNVKVRCRNYIFQSGRCNDKLSRLMFSRASRTKAEVSRRGPIHYLLYRAKSIYQLVIPASLDVVENVIASVNRHLALASEFQEKAFSARTKYPMRTLLKKREPFLAICFVFTLNERKQIFFSALWCHFRYPLRNAC